MLLAPASAPAAATVTVGSPLSQDFSLEALVFPKREFDGASANFAVVSTI
jgi:hypothetical protein